MNIFVLALVGYLLYRFIAGFLIPVFRTTRHMRQQFSDLNGQRRRSSVNTEPESPHANQKSQAGSQPSKVGEYIDFEEIK